MSRKIFLDHVSTTPVDPRVFDSMKPYFTEIFGNPSSLLIEQGNLAVKALDKARQQVARMVNAGEERIVFTSGATEANNLAVIGMAMAGNKEKRHVLISEVEHYSVYNLFAPLKAHGFDVEFIRADKDGRITAEQLKKQIRDDTLLVSVQLANSEVGVIHPVAELTVVAKDFGALFHTDATAGAGLLELDFDGWGVDALTLSAHNFYGPKGAGALVLAKGVKISPRMHGGFQENNLRSGTENVPGIVGMGAAAELAAEERQQRFDKLSSLGGFLKDKLQSEIPFIRFTGCQKNRLPGHVSFWVEHVEGESLILFLNISGVMAASGSACASNLRAEDEHELKSSNVFETVGVPTDICAGTVTMSLGVDNTKEDLEYTVDELKKIVERLLSMSPSYADYLKSQEK